MQKVMSESEYGTFKVVSRVIGRSFSTMVYIKFQLSQARGTAELERAKGYDVTVSRLTREHGWEVVE